MATKYIVSQKIGGVMEDPIIKSVNPETIIANNKEEAVEIYNYRHSCYYYYGSVDEVLGNTISPITEKVILDSRKEKKKQEYLNDN